ncbi:MAG: T9SS C-terminal target domain-containing protein, partial [Ignavibacteriales bacterium]
LERRIDIINLVGKIELSQVINSTITQLDLSLLSKGIYFIKVSDKKGLASISKIVLY